MESAAGLLLLDKAAGLTSFEALGPVKRAFRTGKVGHTGTLDKFATGLLAVLVGRPALKSAQAFTHLDKRYEALVYLGEETDTLDPEGTVCATAPPPEEAALREALAAFRGEILQRPPAYSAIHVNGRRAHELARSGENVKLESRPVTIYALEMCSFRRAGGTALAELEVHCSSGAYVRSLARDLALAAGSRGRLAALRRTQVGAYRVEDALRISGETSEAAIRAALQPWKPRG